MVPRLVDVTHIEQPPSAAQRRDVETRDRDDDVEYDWDGKEVYNLATQTSQRGFRTHATGISLGGRKEPNPVKRRSAYSQAGNTS